MSADEIYEKALIELSQLQREVFARKRNMQYWEERLSPTQHGKVSEALTRFSKTKNDHRLYEDLCNAGMTSEEADEYCNLMVEGE